VHRVARLDCRKVLRSAVVCVELRIVVKHSSQVLGVGVGVVLFPGAVLLPGAVFLPGAVAAC